MKENAIASCIDRKGGTYKLDARDVFLMKTYIPIAARASICCITIDGSEIGICNGQGLRKVQYYTIIEAVRHMPHMQAEIKELASALSLS